MNNFFKLVEATHRWMVVVVRGKGYVCYPRPLLALFLWIGSTESRRAWLSESLLRPLQQARRVNQS